METAVAGGVSPVPTHAPPASTKSTKPVLLCSRESAGDGFSPEPFCGDGEAVKAEVVSDTGRPSPSVSKPQVSDRICSSFCSASIVVEVWPRAMMLTRVDAAQSCATPSDTIVKRPIATTTSMRLKPRLLKLDFSCAIDRYRLGLAFARDRDRFRRRDALRGTGHDHVGRAIRLELEDRARHRCACGQRPHRTVVVRLRHQIGVGRGIRVRAQETSVGGVVLRRADDLYRPEIPVPRAVQTNPQWTIQVHGPQPRALELPLDASYGVIELRRPRDVSEDGNGDRHHHCREADDDHQLDEREAAGTFAQEMEAGTHRTTQLSNGSAIGLKCFDV